MRPVPNPILVTATMLAAAADAGEPSTAQTSPSLPEAKQTALGLYVTSAEAYEKWKSAPDKVKVLDVRTVEEYIFVGHPEMAWCIPFALQTYDWSSSKERFEMTINPTFVSEVKEWAEPTDTIMVMCRSGGRSAMAINVLAQAGFANAYNVTDGMEGDLVSDPGHEFHGKRMKNGWKNSELPWTYDVQPDQIRAPKRP